MSNLSNGIDPEKYERLVRDALANLFDLAALQTHPLSRYLGQALSQAQSRGEALREAMLNAIERLRPAEDLTRPGAPEWRPYLILRWRYVDGIRLAEIQERLALSGRQFRREQGRAVEAVADLLWDQAFPNPPGSPGAPDDRREPARAALQEDRAGGAGLESVEGEQPIGLASIDETFLPGAFPVHQSPLDVFELVQGVIATLQPRAGEEGVVLNLLPCAGLPQALADRVILRQVLISLIRFVMERTQEATVSITCAIQAGKVAVLIQYREPAQLQVAGIENALPERARSLSQMIDASLHWSRGDERSSSAGLSIRLPYSNEPVLLAVDDHEIALRMYKRYTSQLNLRLVGLQDGNQVVETARDLQPSAIILDVMIPNVDGWEVLQALRANPATRHIPVIICTVWDEPELAASLGASGFLKKPFTQQEFLALLSRFGLA